MKWIFEGRVYSSLEEISGKTMSEGNKPELMFTLEEMQNWCMAANYSTSYLSKIDSNMPSFVYADMSIYESIKKKLDVGEGAESESEL